MKKTILIILIFPLFLFSQTPTGGCDYTEIEGFTHTGYFEESNYYISNNPITWEEANTTANLYGGNVLTISTQEEHEYIINNISSQLFFNGTDSYITWVDLSNPNGTLPGYWDNGDVMYLEGCVNFDGGSTNGDGDPYGIFVHDIDPTDLDCIGDDSMNQISGGVLYAVIENPCLNLGCTDIIACNYNPEATEEDGSCEYIEQVTISGETETCEESVLLEAIGGPYDAYQWYLDGDIISGETQPTITANTTGTYKVEVQNSINYSLQLDGENDYVDLGVGPLIGEFSKLTIMTWIKPADNDGVVENANIFSVGSETHWLKIKDQKANFGVSGTGNEVSSTTTIEPDEWTHITGVYTGTEIQIYVNGTLESTNTLTGSYNDTGLPILIGYEAGSNEYYEGLIEEVSVWGEALSEEQIQNYIDCPPTGTETGLINCWKLEEEGQALIFDSTNNTFNGQFVNIITNNAWSTETPEINCQQPCLSSAELFVLINNCGCTDLTADNFDSTANVDDGSCEYWGCTDPTADNFDSTANVDDSSCEYWGCTDLEADNFDSAANVDDGSCEYWGCTDPAADNFDSTANTDDGSCSYFSCEQLTNNLNISTAYDEETETQIPYTFPPNNDPQWLWVNAAEFFGWENNGITPAVVNISATAYDCGLDDPTTFLINNYPENDNEEACDYAGWITPNEQTTWGLTTTPLILETEFCLLEEDNLWFNGALSADNYAQVYFNGGLIGEVTGIENSNYYDVTYIEYYLENISAGTHTVQIHLYNQSGPLGVKLEAFVSSESGNNNLCVGCTGEEILGCTNPGACNYDPNAITDDGSCQLCASREFNDGAYLDVDSEITNAQGITISFWVNDNDFCANPEDFATYIDFGSQDSYRYVVRNRSCKIEAFFEGDMLPTEFDWGTMEWGYPKASAAGSLTPDGTQTGWRQVTAVFCPTTIRLYVDGNIVASNGTGVYFAQGFNLFAEDVKRIGSNQVDYEPANAMIDEVRIWDRALSGEEVLERAGGMTTLDPLQELSLNGYWQMECDDPFLNEITNQQAVESVMEVTTINENFNGNNCVTDTNYDYQCPTGPDMVADCNSCDPPEGCTDEEACNYDYLAVVSIPDACFYIADYCPDLEYPEYYDCDCKCLNDSDFDDICDELEVDGCQDPIACNYNPEGTEPCVYAEDINGVNWLDCDGNCLNDMDGDGVCDEEDNCIDVYNPNQEDLNEDGIGDDCDGVGLEEGMGIKKLIKVTDVLGREINKETKGATLMYWYNTGEVDIKHIF